jgi:hypothetical protein
MDAPHKRMTDFHKGDRLLLFALVLGPMAALIQLTTSYALVPSACANGSKAMLHITSTAFFAVALIGAWIGRRAHRPANDERTRWMALVATILSISSALLIVAMEIPNVILRSCD